MSEICPIVNTERLLLATESSEFSEGAIRESIQLAKRCGSKLTAMSVIESNPEFESEAPAILEKMEKEVLAHLESVKARAKQGGVACETITYEGEDSYKYIVEESVKQKSTMIIMGRRGKKGFRRLVMGSTTSWTIGHAPCSVMVVPRAAQVDFKSIVVATDGSKYSNAAASEAIGIAKRNNAKLTVLAVVPADIAMPTEIDFSALQREKIADQDMQAAEKNAKAVKDAAQKAGVDAQAFVMSGKPADAIIEIARDKTADLIVVGSHGRTGLDRLLMGSVTERVIVMSSCAVLAVKGK